jgi:monofunctional biosynthetic peptidoglycan transglycosylase
MSVVREKMRHMRRRLKSGSDTIGQTIRSRAQDITQACRKAWQWPADRWSARKAASAPLAETVWADAATEGNAVSAGESAEKPPRAWRLWLDSHPRVEKALQVAAVSLGVVVSLPYVFILLYRFVDPPISALTLRHAVLGYDVNREWVDFNDISPHLARAAVIAEDSRFCQHWGVDWFAVGEALDDLEVGERPRGASTIPMQTAKNLFLWPEQSYMRKALEVPLAYFMSLVWPKQRVIEIYLNIAEWGPGVYGAEAAARTHFGTSAASLSRAQAALLVSALPNPVVRKAGKPGPAMRRRANRIQARVGRESQDAACIFESN